MEKISITTLFIGVLVLSLIVTAVQYQHLSAENAGLKLQLAKQTDLVNLPENELNSAQQNNIDAKPERDKVDIQMPHLTQKYPPSKQMGSVSSISNLSIGNQEAKVLPFDQQQVDYEWANLMETAVSDVFQTSEYLQELTLEKVECRSTLCQVRMPKAQPDTLHQATLVLMALSETDVPYKSVKLSPDVEDDTVIFYFEKLGK